MIILKLDHVTPYGCQLTLWDEPSLPHSVQKCPLVSAQRLWAEKTFWEMAKLDAFLKLQYFYSLPNKRISVAVLDQQMDNTIESTECFGKECENRENLWRSSSWHFRLRDAREWSDLCLQQVPVPMNFSAFSHPCKCFTFTESSASEFCRSVPIKAPPARHKIAWGWCHWYSHQFLNVGLKLKL